MRTIALVANYDSGRDGDASRAEQALIDAGAEVETFEIDEPDKAAASGADRVAVAGGDGSLGFAARATGEADVPLAVLATGTANDFARSMSLPQRLEEAAQLAVTGELTRQLELGCAGSRPFVNVASAGLAPRAAREAAPRKQRFGALAYPIGAMRAATTSEPIEICVEVDDDVLFEGPAWQVTVACTGAFGGGSELADADPGDGKLDVAVIEATGRMRLARRALGMRTGSLTDQPGVEHTVGTRVRIRGASEFNVDGEILDLGDPVEFSVSHEAYRLVAG